MARELQVGFSQQDLACLWASESLSMFRQISIPWPLVLAAGVIALLWMSSFPLADVGQDIANRVLLRPLENAMRQIW